MPKGPVLFVSHDAGLTGAPLLLLHLVRWLRANTKLDFKVALKAVGPLERQFAEVAPTAVFDRPAVSWPDRIGARLARYGGREDVDAAKFTRELGSSRFDLLYSNTIVNGDLLRRLPDQHCPLISHVHELDYMIRRFTNAEDLSYTLARTSRFICGSGAVADNLVHHHSVPRSKVEVVYDFIPALDIDRQRLTKAADDVRAEMGIPAEAVIIGAAGTVDWRKGYDAFLQLAAGLCRGDTSHDLHFVWVGANGDQCIGDQIAHDLQRLGLEKRVHFVGQRSNYLAYLAMFDVFCLTSREDPFPLVVLESAVLGKPVLCFESSGGSPEFVQTECGFVVPYLDVPAMVRRVIELIENPTLRLKLGANGEARVRAEHDVTVVGPHIVEIIERTIATLSFT